MSDAPTPHIEIIGDAEPSDAAVAALARLLLAVVERDEQDDTEVHSNEG